MINVIAKDQLYSDIYRQMGLNEASIQDRLTQARQLANFNIGDPYAKSGGGALMATDSQGRNGYIPFVVHDEAESRIAQKAMENLGMFATDSDTASFNIPSSGVPLPLLTIWTTRMIEQLYKKVTLSQLTGSWQQGAPGAQEVKIPIIAYDGDVAIYDDYSMNGNTSINVNWATRSIAYFEQTLGWGDMQQAQFSMAKIDYVAKLREAGAITASQFQNDLGFNGYTGVAAGEKPQLTGILNDLNLNDAISLPADGQIPGTITPTTAWSGKDFNQIVRDVRLLVQQVINQSEGQVSNQSKFVLVIPPSADASLETPNPLSSKAVETFLREVYKNIEIVVTPNFQSEMVTTGAQTQQSVVMVLFQHPNGEMPYDELFVTKWQSHRPMPMASAISEKISYGLGGTILKYPFLVSYAYGV